MGYDEKREGKKGREQTDPRGLFLGIRFPFSQMLQEHYFIAFIFLILFFLHSFSSIFSCINYCNRFVATEDGKQFLPEFDIIT